MKHSPIISKPANMKSIPYPPRYAPLFVPLCAVVVASLWVLSACTRTAEPSAEVFTSAMNSYLAKRGDLCLGKNAWPIDVTQHEVDVGARNALQMPVLEKLGLVASTVAQVDVNDEGTLHHMKVRRFALTDAGHKYYLTRDPGRETVKTSVAAAPKGDFCAAKLSLDHVVGWELHQTTDTAQRQAVVSYTYRIDAAPWAQDAQVQKVFPVVSNVLRGAGTAQLQETFTLTNAGWVAVDLQGS